MLQGKKFPTDLNVHKEIKHNSKTLQPKGDNETFFLFQSTKKNNGKWIFAKLLFKAHEACIRNVIKE